MVSKRGQTLKVNTILEFNLGTNSIIYSMYCKVKWVRASVSFHITPFCLNCSAVIMMFYSSATFSEEISHEYHSSSRSSTDKDIKGKLERRESFHSKHPLMNCPWIQLSPFQPVACHQCAQLYVQVCAKEMERERALLWKSNVCCCCCVWTCGPDALHCVNAPFRWKHMLHQYFHPHPFSRIIFLLQCWQVLTPSFTKE